MRRLCPGDQSWESPSDGTSLQGQSFPPQDHGLLFPLPTAEATLGLGLPSRGSSSPQGGAGTSNSPWTSMRFSWD